MFYQYILITGSNMAKTLDKITEQVFTFKGYLIAALISGVAIYMVTGNPGLSIVFAPFAPFFLMFGYVALSFLFVMIMHVAESFVDAIKNSPGVIFFLLALVLPGIVANVLQNEILFLITTVYYVGMVVLLIAFSSGWSAVAITFFMIIFMLSLR